MRPLLIVAAFAAHGCGRSDLSRGPQPDVEPSAALIASIPVVVPATANIWGAGHEVPPALASGPGVLPTTVALSGAGRTVRLSSVSGTVAYAGSLPENGADGVARDTYTFGTLDGVAGPVMARGRCLVAVFLDDTEPTNPPPPALVIADVAAVSFRGISTRQIFFVGDGLTGTDDGTTQVFAVPEDATRLFFGFMDSSTSGLIGRYSDNVGSVAATVSLFGPVE